MQFDEYSKEELINELKKHQDRLSNLEKELAEQKEVEDLLRERMVRYRTIIEDIEDGYYEVDLSGNITFFNNALCAILGYNKSETLGLHYKNLMDEENRKETFTIFNTVYSTGIHAKIASSEIICKDGTKKNVEASISLIKDNEDNPVGFRGIVRDITENKRMQNIVELEREQLLAIFDSIDEPIYITDPKSYKLLYANKATTSIFGDILGKTCYRVFHNKESECEFCTNSRLFGENFGITIIWDHKNEKVGRWYRCIDRAIRWPDERDVRYEMAIDITEQKLAEEAFERMNVAGKLVGEMILQIKELGAISNEKMYEIGQNMAKRLQGYSLQEYLNAYSDMGLGTLSLTIQNEENKEWFIIGDGILEGKEKTNEPVHHLTRGYLCYSVARLNNSQCVEVIEQECQAKGDKMCLFKVKIE